MTTLRFDEAARLYGRLFYASLTHMTSIVTIGGGTGQYALLTGLKKYPVHLTAIVTMADDGGSTGVLRDELGVLPPGDVRQCLVALSEADAQMRELFGYRFDRGGLRGHSFGNIFLSALERLTGSFEEAVVTASKVLAVRGDVIPVSTRGMVLTCRAGDGALGTLRGEHVVSAAPSIDPASLRLDPVVEANPRALAAIAGADAVVIGPGNFFCSVMPNLLVRGIPEAIAATKAKVIFNCNLMTRRGHTDGYGVADFVREIERHIGAGRIDAVTANDTPPDPELRARYAEEGEPVLAGIGSSGLGTTHGGPGGRVFSADLVSRVIPAQKPEDAVRRTLIRHDSDALAALIMERCLGVSRA
ncbi:MAG: hypothetical protein RLZZ324_439 [Candidatus Parcubacteria bacterium]|jgi:uncharacterized cofD-like protein